jgi:phenylpyruvate tautomerase PptA (4-oxalocrotonate tautomerase family)
VRLAKDISASSSRIAGIPQARILVSLQEFQARFAVEYGRALPEPDAEDDWLAESNDLIPLSPDPMTTPAHKSISEDSPRNK